MQKTLKKYWLLLIALILILLSLAILILSGPYLSSEEHTAISPRFFDIIHKKDFGGSFELINHDGVMVRSSTYNSEYKLVYFGFTHCPDICPTTLKKISLVLGLLHADKSLILPVFITVDPDRDTPETLKSYLSHFTPNFMGFTGTPEEIKAVLMNYRVFSEKASIKSESDYLINHTSFMYLTDKYDKIVEVLNVDQSPETIANSIRSAIEEKKRS